MTRAYFSLGSNLGRRGEYLALGVAIMSAGDPHRSSRVYRSEPVGPVPQDDFWNLVLEVETSATPYELLGRVRQAESAALRIRTEHWGPRTLDVDIIWIDGVRSEEKELTLPHPRLYERNFVLVPWRELRPDLVGDDHLRLGRGAVEFLGTLETLL